MCCIQQRRQSYNDMLSPTEYEKRYFVKLEGVYGEFLFTRRSAAGITCWGLKNGRGIRRVGHLIAGYGNSLKVVLSVGGEVTTAALSPWPGCGDGREGRRRGVTEVRWRGLRGTQYGVAYRQSAGQPDDTFDTAQLPPQACGDIYLVFEPNVFINDFDGLIVASFHGSPWRYDTYVPTMAAYLNMKPPSGNIGAPLSEVLGK